MLNPPGGSTTRQGNSDQSGRRHRVDEARSLVGYVALIDGALVIPKCSLPSEVLASC